MPHKMKMDGSCFRRVLRTYTCVVFTEKKRIGSRITQLCGVHRNSVRFLAGVAENVSLLLFFFFFCEKGINFIILN